MAGRWASAVPRRALQPVDKTELDQPGSEASGTEQLSFGQHVLAFFKELAAVIVGAVIVASLLRGFVGQMFLIPSISMENTLQVDDRVVVDKLGAIKRGEVVVFKDPGGLANWRHCARARSNRQSRSSSWVCCLTPARST